MNKIQKWLLFFENISCFFKQFFLLPLWNKYNNHPNDIWHSLAIFLEGYAFERQGRNASYFHAAVDTLLKYKKEHNDIIDKSTAKDIWRHFSKLFNNQQLNEQNNPLCPWGTNYSKNYNKEPRNYTTSKRSIMEVVFGDIVPQRLTFTNHFKNKITEENDVQNAHKSLKSIQGIGNKIASLYLRDLAFVMNIDLGNIENRHLLQPIDTWVARTIISLNSNGFAPLQEKINNNNLNDNDKKILAKWIVEQSNERQMNPELVNMGIWFFGSQIVISKYRLNRTLGDTRDIGDTAYAETLVVEYANRFKNVCQNCQNLLQI
ncbi:MAG: hypothetical protein ACYSSL_09995 [Planctomycetota bacterium]|jgi:hypothetical protein